MSKARAYVTEQTDHFIMGLVGTVLIGLSLLSHPTLREFSAVVSTVCVMGLLWRIIGDSRKMTMLSLLLSLALGLNLATAAVAQYLLAQQVHAVSAEGPPPPDNTLGITLVLTSRLFTLFVIVFWERWLDDEPIRIGRRR